MQNATATRESGGELIRTDTGSVAAADPPESASSWCVRSAQRELVATPSVVRPPDTGDARIRKHAPSAAYPDHLVRFRGSPLPPSDPSCFLLVQLDSALYICRTATWVGPSDVGAALE